MKYHEPILLRITAQKEQLYNGGPAITRLRVWIGRTARTHSRALPGPE